MHLRSEGPKDTERDHGKSHAGREGPRAGASEAVVGTAQLTRDVHVGVAAVGGCGVVLDVGRAGGVKRLDLNEPVGTGPIEAKDDNVGSMGETSANATHPLGQPLLALALVEEDGSITEARAQDHGKRAHGRVVARPLPANADWASDVVPVGGENGGKRRRSGSARRREAAAMAVGGVAVARDAREEQKVQREGSGKVSARIGEAKQPAADARVVRLLLEAVAR